ncbi:unnamed protein product [Rotaria sordida]|uniref:PARP catalytic domain-containing protein n=1 Tax=Rotaria sordida TaxID=392033 RepID=A0A818SG65_9BILA|nr:unnamed protein product [Rotaria sordida]CAF1017930.1 unnamed protein product [Rotaria sordida]CAF1043343.1 unnamed protein product [Rotaria sordida]CAF3662891.1 unnamed protein product [Rotaria sordida]CAF3662905.1 unnamed protein product [Rotaria sordida]
MWLKDDFKRYHYLVVLHTICTIAFVVRFIVLCTDLSSAKSDSIAFPVIILLLELGSSFITLIGNCIYIFLRYLGPILFESDHEKVGCCSQLFAWNLSTLTCFRCECYREHPQLVLVTRLSILILFEAMRFIAFILACVCANRYGPIGLGYSILAAFSFVPAVILLVVEYLHHHRLWFHYRPDTSSEEKPQYINEHKRFLPIAMTNDQQTSHWQNSRCDKGKDCLSRNLYHVIIYHSGNTRYPPEQTKDNQIVVGFHQTSHAAACSIAKTQLKPSSNGWIGPGIYFATSLNHTEFKANQFGAYICAKVDLGKTKRITHPKDWSSGDQCDTVYYEHPHGADEFCVQNEQQIRSWIIVIDQDPNVRFLQEKNNKPLPSGKYVEDRLEDIVYQGCWL